MDRRILLALGPFVTLLAKDALGGNEEPAAGTAPRNAPPPEKPPLFTDDAQFWCETQQAFGAAEYGGSLFGEVLAVASSIKPGDYDSWYDAWNTTADRIHGDQAAPVISRSVATTWAPR
jgi:hypothetical protein